jgi:predicted  nucleic acid-binding Zn-ribbon protein
MAKLSKEELEQLQQLNTEFTKMKISLGDLEIQKSSIISEIAAIKMKFAQHEKKLIEKYGEESVINIQTGEVQQKGK